MMFPYLGYPTSSKFRRHCMDWVNILSSIHFGDYIVHPNLPIIILDSANYPLVKGLITKSSLWWYPLNSDIRWSRCQFNSFVVRSRIVQKENN